MSLIGSTEVKKKLIGRVYLLREIPGFSAYDLAVKHGFKGTEEEWVASIKGEKGDPGTLESHTEVNALGHRVINVAEPTADTDAVTKVYADGRYIQIETLDALYGEHKKPSADDVGSITCYRALNGIGLSDEAGITYTTEEVCAALPLWSTLLLCTAKTKITDLPISWGTLEIVKGDTNYCVARLTNSSGTSTDLFAFIGRYAANQSNKWSGWFRFNLTIV